jgi:transposase
LGSTSTCRDYEERGLPCKHIFAARYTIEREYSDDGSLTETITVQTVRKTYPQNWRAYNAAQTNEKDKFQSLLRDLCAGIVEQKTRGHGRPRIPLSDAIFSAVFKVYSTVSGRRFMSDLRAAQEAGHITRTPCYNSIFNILENEGTSAILTSLVLETANPLKAIETTFACDSSGFSGCRFDRWYDHKWGEYQIQRAWVKAHIMTGVKTNVITAVEIHGQHANDSVQLKPLLDSTVERFSVNEVCGDLGYSSHANLKFIDAVGAMPLIPFKRNATPAQGGLWEKMFHYFSFNRQEFLGRYHQRSNVESTFSMLKAKFGDGVRSKTDVAMKNEVLAKMVCHNICCLISAMYELGLDPVFWAEQPVAQNIAQN